ncbi:MAG: Ig-like domain-containing protein [Nitrospira sp.]|nr:Ig-like domain-containing protein [Nitrospira sp.]
MVLFTLGMTASVEAAVFDLSTSWRERDSPTGYTYVKICIVSGSSAFRQPPENIAVHSIPSLETVIGKVRDSLRTSWEQHSSIRFVGWENCGDLNPALKSEYVGLFIYSDIGNHSAIGKKAKGTTGLPGTSKVVDKNGKPVLDENGKEKTELNGPGGPQFAPFGNVNPCIEYNSKIAAYRYKFDCAREYGIHEFGHAIGFLHEWQHPLTPSTCAKPAPDSEEPLVAAAAVTTDAAASQGYLVPNKDFDFDSVMTYGDNCAHVTGTRFGSPAPDEYDRSAVRLAYPPVPLNDFDVGVIPDSNSACPVENRVTVYLDNEDDPTPTGGNQRAGWNGVIRSDRNTRLEFCRVDGRKFGRHQPPNVGAPTNTDYAVLKLGTMCPAGSQEIVREFDDENDLYNEDWMGGDLGQNQQFSDTESRTLLHFCWFRRDRSDGAVMSSFPQLGFDYGVIGVTYNAVRSGWIYIDDENDKNHDSFRDASGFFLSDSDIRALSPLMNGDINTTIQLALVKQERAPTAADQSVLADGIAQGNLLNGASDPDGDAVKLDMEYEDADPMTKYLRPAHGTLEVNETGGFVYTPDDGYTGTDTFAFRVTDGYMRSTLATVSISIPPAPILTIALDAQPASSLTFNASNGETFTLVNGKSRDVTFKAKQDAIVTAPVPAGWYLANIACTENSGAIVDLVAGQVQIGVHAAQRLSCTYQLRQYGSFDAFVYRDRNANGRYDNTKDKPLAGWSVQLFDEFNILLDEKATNAEGKVHFTLLQQRQYKVCEVLKPGWRNSDPGSTAGQSCKIMNVGGGAQPPIRFGNVKR